VALEVRRFLAGGDRRFGVPDLEHIQSVTLSDVENWVGPAIRRDPLELSMVGDLDPDAVVDLAARYLGALERADAPAHPRRPGAPDFPRGKELTVRVDTRIPKGLVQMAYPTDDIRDIGQTRRLATLANVFSDRLREELRERLGATYSPYAFNDPSRTYDGYGLMQAVVSIDPEDADTVTGAIRKIIADLNQNGVTAEELERALKPTINGIRDMRRKNGYWLNTVLTGSREYPEQLEWAQTIEADYRSITAEEVSRLAAVFLKNEAAAEVVIRPDPAVAEAAAAAGAGG
jgi:zinc protease